MNLFTPVLSDLGMTQTANEAKDLFIGTPYYLGKSVYDEKYEFISDKKMDIFALGLTMLETVLNK